MHLLRPGRLLLHTDDPHFPTERLLGKLACTTHALRPFSDLLNRWLLKILAQAHLPQDALPLKLLLKNAKRLVDVVVADEYLQGYSSMLIDFGASHSLNFEELAIELLDEED